MTKDMFKVDFALQGSNRKLQPENHKPKADRAETPWLRNISALETPHTFPLESLITAWASRSSCQCCCHGNMVCTRGRESERQQPPPPPTPFVWNLHYRCVVLGCFGATQLRICICHQTSGMNTTSGSWRDSVSCDTFIIFEADVTSPLPSPKLFFCILPTIFCYNRMWNDICLIPGHYCNYRAAAAVHVNHDSAEEGARRTHT